ncbi:MAG: 6-bladed beta-propeller [Bacteroidales bacterium]|nr:6-bladed beta-propeller [Bacteroidales bacterium]
MRYLIVPIILLCLLACTNEKNQKLETIIVSPARTSEVNLSEIAESVQLIPLETNDSCLVSYITSLDLCDNYIFICSGNRSVMQFDNKGKFIRQIGREGKGPAEYIFPGNITCNAKNQRIYIAAQQQILCFGFDGKYISSIKLPQLIEYITVINNQLLAFYTKFGEKIDDKMINRSLANIYSTDGKLVDSLEIKNIELDNISGTINPGAHYLSQAAGHDYFYYPVLISEPVTRDTLYQFARDQQFIPRYKIDFGINNIDEIKKKKLLIKNIYRTDRYLFTEYYYEGKPLFFCYDLKNNTQQNTANGFYDDLHQITNIVLYPVKHTPNLMYAIKNAYELSDKNEGIDENDNPVLMLVKLKE